MCLFSSLEIDKNELKMNLIKKFIRKKEFHIDIKIKLMYHN